MGDLSELWAKMQVGKYSCPACGALNPKESIACPCCEAPNPNLSAPAAAPASAPVAATPTFSFGFNAAAPAPAVAVSSTPTFSFGFNSSASTAPAPAPAAAPSFSFGAPASAAVSASTSSFTFGSSTPVASTPVVTAAPAVEESNENVASDLSAVWMKFNDPAKSWSCPTCSVTSLITVERCPCCEEPNPNYKKPELKSLKQESFAPVPFSWGTPAVPAPAPAPSPVPAPAVASNANFSWGGAAPVTSTTTVAAPTFSWGTTTAPTPVAVTSTAAAAPLAAEPEEQNAAKNYFVNYEAGDELDDDVLIDDADSEFIDDVPGIARPEFLSTPFIQTAIDDFNASIFAYTSTSKSKAKTTSKKKKIEDSEEENEILVDHLQMIPSALTYTHNSSVPLTQGSLAHAYSSLVTLKSKKGEDDKYHPHESNTNHTFLFSVGSGECEQLGLGSSTYSLELPRIIPTLARVSISRIAVGGLHSLALDSYGHVFSWGCNDDKALGRTGAENVPGLVRGLLDSLRVIQVACGDSHSVALDESGRVFSWGTYKGADGYLGFSSVVKKQEVPFFQADVFEEFGRAVAVSSGADHTGVLTQNGACVLWGYDGQGQCGRGAPKMIINDESGELEVDIFEQLIPKVVEIPSVEGNAKKHRTAVPSAFKTLLKTDNEEEEEEDDDTIVEEEEEDEEEDAPPTKKRITTPSRTSGRTSTRAKLTRSATKKDDNESSADVEPVLGGRKRTRSSTIDSMTSLDSTNSNASRTRSSRRKLEIPSPARSSSKTVAKANSKSASKSKVPTFTKLTLDKLKGMSSEQVEEYQKQLLQHARPGNYEVPVHCEVIEKLFCAGYSTFFVTSTEVAEKKKSKAKSLQKDESAVYNPSAALVFACGMNSYSQLGLGHTGDVREPILVPGLSRIGITLISGGSQHTLALNHRGRVLAFGRADSGQLGLGSVKGKPSSISSQKNLNVPVGASAFYPVVLPASYFKGVPVVSVSANGCSSLAVDALGNLFTWGFGESGQLSNRGEGDENIPRLVNSAVSYDVSRHESLRAQASIARSSRLDKVKGGPVADKAEKKQFGQLAGVSVLAAGMGGQHMLVLGSCKGVDLSDDKYALVEDPEFEEDDDDEEGEEDADDDMEESSDEDEGYNTDTDEDSEANENEGEDEEN